VKSLSSFKHIPNEYWDVVVRSKNDGYDIFDDMFYTFLGSELVMTSTGTSNAGSEGLMNYEKYNKLGCAVLKSDIIVYNSHTLGKHKNKYTAYVQSYSTSFPYYRDANKNKKAEETGTVYTNRIGANCHKAGVRSKLIGGWSVACLVRNVEEDYNKWLKLLNGQKNLTVCILKEW
jgi:hypothetical protein